LTPILGDIIAADKPVDVEEPLGPKTREWVLNKLKGAANGAWKMSLAFATKVISEAALRFYGLK
jgi:hypothetical protein